MKPTIQTDNYTLYHADCLDVLPTLAAGSVDVLLTDTPYGIEGGAGGQARQRGKGKYKSGEWQDTPQYIRRVVVPAIELSLSKVQRGAVMSGWKHLQAYPQAADMGSVFTPSACGRGPWGFSTSNPILYYGKSPRAGKGEKPNGFATTDGNRGDFDFPCPKPLSWMLWLVDKMAIHPSVFIDPFMGSGTTGVACAKMGHKFIGIERDRYAFDIAAARIANAYGDLMPTPAEAASPQLSMLHAIA